MMSGDMAGDDPRDDGSPPVSPAARQLLAEIRRFYRCRTSASATGADARGLVPHRGAIDDARRTPMLEELLAAGEVFELERGHVIDRESLADLGGRLETALHGGRNGSGRTLSTREVAALWGSSHGHARAILTRMVQEGRVRREDGRVRLADPQSA